ncbi:MAG: DUF4279 domain-containing protein [Solirubrobacteraceae bacterium]|nr:DUF4279 domain-containing protein [Solirubrobacteraceae bacterium]
MNSLEENGNCLMAHATFRVVGEDLDPDEVSAALGLTPSHSLRRDQFVPTATEVRRQETGVWLLKSEGKVESTSLERHLMFLLDQVEPGAAALDELRRTQTLTTDFFCFWMSATGHGGPIFSAPLMQRVAAVGAELGIDFYGGVVDDTATDLKPAPRTRLTVVRSPESGS